MSETVGLERKVIKVFKGLFGLLYFLLILFLYTGVYLPIQAALGLTGLLSIVTTVIGLMVIFAGFYILMRWIK